jgi:hypothetical protein
MNFYFASKRIIEPTIGNNGTSFVVVEPPIAHFEPVDDTNIDPPIHRHGVENVINLPERKGLLFCNQVKTDGLTCKR